LHSGMAIDTCVKNFSGSIMKGLAASAPKRRPRVDPRPPIPAGIQDEIRMKNQLRRRWQVTGDPALRAEVKRLQGSVTRSSMSGGTTSGVQHSSPSIPRTNRCGG
jgi:hypothetical protein